jgi:hypothetical protein
MDGDTEGSGPVGGKFKRAGRYTDVSPSEQQTITFTNGKKVTTNKLSQVSFSASSMISSSGGAGP